jgi:hypothetical protein
VNAKPTVNDQFESLLATVERLRKEQFQHLPPELVATILHAHAVPGAEAEAIREVEKAVEVHERARYAPT